MYNFVLSPNPYKDYFLSTYGQLQRLVNMRAHHITHIFCLVINCWFGNYFSVRAEIVDFVASATTVCTDEVVTFNCTAVGNPAVHTYKLYSNDKMVNESSSGLWRQSMTTAGQFVYTCVANNTLGSDNRTVNLTVNGKFEL